jgi:hypothetical protein
MRKRHIKSESQPTTAMSANGSTILAISGAMSSKLVIGIEGSAQRF